jgi:hypothetical protein
VLPAGGVIVSRRIYVASSWRNEHQPDVVGRLRDGGHEVYDFRHPAEGNDGFTWKDVMPSWSPTGSSDGLVPVGEYVANIDHPHAVDGFRCDFDAMRWADTCVLVLPCGRSAHLELGWFVGAGRRTAILLDGPLVTPELMYRMVDFMSPSIDDVCAWLVGGDVPFTTRICGFCLEPISAHTAAELRSCDLDLRAEELGIGGI